MKTLKLILALATILLISPSCRKGSIWGIYGKGAGEVKTYSLSGFSSISLDCDGEVDYVQDSVYLVTVEAQQNILSVMECKVVDSELRIGFLREVRKHDGVKITVHSPYMNGMLINGSGGIVAKSGINTNRISLYINGSGNITLASLNSSDIDSKISGSGNISVNGGTGQNAVFSISGSGNVYTSSMTCSEATIRISGSGNVSVKATDKLHVTLSGSGDVRYKGKPAIDSKVSGSGRLIPIS